MRLRGYGVPRMNKGNRGDAYVRLIVGVPKKLDKRQKELIEELKDSGL